MSANTKIEWCDHTFNPWVGCMKVGPGCDNCYAEADFDKHRGFASWGAGQPRRRTGVANWRKPWAWNRAHTAFYAEHGRRQRVFCASLADVFDNEVDPQWRRDLFELIELTPNLDWLLLTKRIGNVARMLPPHNWAERGNVWLGATICNQAEADRDIPKLLAVPARLRFLSMEPLLGHVDLSPWLDYCEKRDKRGISRRDGGQHIVCDKHCGVSWVIVGGESGAGARPMHPEWVRSLRDPCCAAGVPFLFKQWGEWREPLSGQAYDTTMGQAQRVPALIVSPAGTVHCFENEQTQNGGCAMLRVSKKAAGRMLDGRTWDGTPSSPIHMAGRE